MTTAVHIMKMTEHQIVLVLGDQMIQSPGLPLTVDFPGRNKGMFDQFGVFPAHQTHRRHQANILDDLLIKGGRGSNVIVGNIQSRAHPKTHLRAILS
ncbi:hypothetical protein SDC9_26550 [bioreactor metagenome]|uniref:Uncharacterized protein n=1 Tax=bioreactor metagenome TaxID=1076179 RepID=A0A644UNY3_9ZZZZ